MDALLRNIAVIGDATKTLPDDVRGKMPGIEWMKTFGMRNWISHTYYRVDDVIVRDAVENKIPDLVLTLRIHKDESQK